MQTVSQLLTLRHTVSGLKNGGKTLALVPTMGALHEGHMALVTRAAQLADKVAVSIFVNPTQFGPNEDLDAYPRQMTKDCALLAEAGVDLLWAPTVDVMYPEGFATNISVARLGEGLCGASRPGHFDGVATVVCKLFAQVAPDIACFGEKDFQQLAIIRAMTRDLNLPVDIVGVPTVRDDDGLALSSRNAYLSKTQRLQAAALPEALKTAIAALRDGQSAHNALADIEKALLSNGFSSMDYVSLVDAHSLQRLDHWEKGAQARLLVAARMGSTRLIDNMAV